MNMFEEFKSYRAIIVTGPQRSGTRIASKMIAHDTGHTFVDERDFGVYDFDRWCGYVMSNVTRLNPVQQQVVIHCPAMSRFAHLYGERNDMLVVWMIRSFDDIHASEGRISWGGQFNHAEMCRYLRANEREGKRSAEVKTAFWQDVQRAQIACALELLYPDLSDHPLWIDKKDRAGFSPYQTTKSGEG